MPTARYTSVRASVSDQQEPLGPGHVPPNCLPDTPLLHAQLGTTPTTTGRTPARTAPPAPLPYPLRCRRAARETGPEHSAPHRSGARRRRTRDGESRHRSTPVRGRRPLGQTRNPADLDHNPPRGRCARPGEHATAENVPRYEHDRHAGPHGWAAAPATTSAPWRPSSSNCC
ncbi:hypothetical protein SMALA_5286 [Streptomyces malaysiensis subsp. malaysiensis]|nr:hypothetical protein SMALA_5286 [Streptomyces malaysiensis]